MLDTDTFIYLSFALSFGAPMLLAWRELHMVKPKRRRGGGDGNALPPAPVQPGPDDGDDALPPLPDSLREAAKGGSAPQRPKVLEPA
jgi:hypothetical protein